jgi:hypothetical protein
MKISKLAFIPLSTLLIFGCNHPFTGSSSYESDTVVVDDDDDSSTDTENLGAQILDTVTDDGGELRIKLADAGSVDTILEGQISATIQIQDDTDTTVTTTDSSDTAYVTLYSTGGTSSTNYHGDIIFSSGDVKYRDDTGTQYTIDGLSYTEGVAIDFVATWTESTYSFSIDGGDNYNGPYDSREATAVSVISFKLGDTSGQSVKELLVDDIVILDETANAFDDDFESNEVDDVLDGTDDSYNSSSSEATVQLVAFGTAE